MTPRHPRQTESPPAVPAVSRRTASEFPTRAGLGILALLAALSSSPGAEPTSVPSSLEELPDTVNVHHETRYCQLCHPTGPNGPIPSQVRFKNDYRAGCACHYRTPGDLRHPTDVAVPDDMRPRVQDLFPLTDGKATCVTCHSFAVLCSPEHPRRSSLRGAPYADRTAFCFRCHDAKQYERLDPHHQLDAAGNIVPEKCLYCHTRKPDENTATSTSVRLIGDLEKLCDGCHNVGPLHPAGKAHLVTPDLEYRYRMRQIEKQYGIVLPLNEDGRITCITCHNPHEAGVIPKRLPGAKGAGEKLRHRLPGTLCAECHFRSAVTPFR